LIWEVVERKNWNGGEKKSMDGIGSKKAVGRYAFSSMEQQ
jgi:hypothetical protein